MLWPPFLCGTERMCLSLLVTMSLDHAEKSYRQFSFYSDSSVKMLAISYVPKCFGMPFA